MVVRLSFTAIGRPASGCNFSPAARLRSISAAVAAEVARAAAMAMAESYLLDQKRLLAGAAFLIPVILVYTAYSYWVFRGKIEPGGGGYH